MKKIYTVIGILMLMAFVQPSSAQTIHALVTGATNDPSIGKGVRQDLIDMNNLIQNAAGVLDCEFVPECFEDAECTRKHVVNWIENLDVEPDDVVLFYYSGHGGRAVNSADSFPQMCMNNPNNRNLYMPVSEVVSLIKKKSPRLCIVLSDCCNSNDPWLSDKPGYAVSRSPYSSISEYNIKALRDLFIKSRGSVVMTGSKPRQASWGFSDGGLFTHKFVDAFNEAVKTAVIPADWDSIFKSLRSKSMNNGKYSQEPYALITSGNVSGSNLTLDTNPSVQPPNGIPTVIRETLFDSLQYLLNSEVDVDKRLAKIPEIMSRYFTHDAKVMTIAANGRTVVDYEDAEKFLKRIAISPYIIQINVISGSSDEKNSVIKVHELRK